MATPMSSLPASAQFLFNPTPKPTPPLLFKVRSANDENPPSPSEPESGDPFEERLSEVRLRYRMGRGKKAELRKARKAASSSRSGAKAGIYLPPVQLADAESEGLKVEFGFSPYSERVNGRVAALGLTALLMVELATGKSVINYHTPGIVLLQVYFVAAVTAMYCKYEKEKISVWPQSSSVPNE